MKPPAQREPSRASASSFSSTAVTSQPSSARSRATAEPTLPQPITTSFMTSAYRPRGRLAGRRRRGPRTVRCGARSRPWARRRRDWRRQRGEEPRTIRSEPRSTACSTIARPSERARTVTGSTRTPFSSPSSTRLRERGGRLLLELESGASSSWSSGTTITKSASTRALALLRQRDRGRHHLLADRPELHRHEHAPELGAGAAAARPGSTSASSPMCARRRTTR